MSGVAQGLAHHLLHLHAFVVGIIHPSLWDKWYTYIRDHPERAFVPRYVAEDDAMLSLITIAVAPPDFPDHFVLHPWRVEIRRPNICVLQPRPYLMAATLEDARALLPRGAHRIDGVELIPLYREAWLL